LSEPVAYLTFSAQNAVADLDLHLRVGADLHGERLIITAGPRGVALDELLGA
jgi:hypothetical protein